MNTKKLKVIGLTCIIGVSILTGCGKSEKETGLNNTGEKVKTTISGNITAVGSSALQPLAEAAGKVFYENNPDVRINVQGGGSGQGLSQIAAGTVEIGNSDVFAEEKNIDSTDLEDNKVAVVGMGPVVNKDVKIDNLTQKELIDIFTGKITNWNEVGGDNQPIIIINRAEGSGTRATFEKFALNGLSAIKSQEQDNSGAVQKIISETPGSISYLAFSYYNDKVKPLKINGVEPKAENVENNKWKIWSYEHMYTKKNPDYATKAFIEFIKSDEVQKNIVSDLGYISISGMKYERDSSGNVTEIK